MAVLLISIVPTAGHCAEQSGELYRIGAFHYARADWQEAVDNFQRFLDQSPDDPRVADTYFYLAEANVQLRDFKAAVKSYQAHLLHAPEGKLAEQAEFRVGECYFLAGDYDTAATAFAEFRRLRPESPLLKHAWPYLGEVAAKKEDWTQSISMFERAVDEAPNPALRIEFRLQLARIYAQVKRYDEANLAYDQLLEDTSKHASKVQVDAIVLEAGMARFNSRHFRRAIEHFQAAISASPGKSELAKFWVAKTYFEVRDWENTSSVLEVLTDAETLEKFQPEIHYLLAKSLLESDQKDRAATIEQKLLAEWPQSTWALALLEGDLDRQLAIGNTEAAQEVWQTISTHPKATTASQVKLASHYQKNGDHTSALEVLRKPTSHDSLYQDEVDYAIAVSLFSLEQVEAAKLQLAKIDAEDATDRIAGLAKMLEGVIALRLQEWATANEKLAAAMKHLQDPAQLQLASARRIAALIHLAEIDEAKSLFQKVAWNQLSEPQRLDELSQIARAAYDVSDFAWAKAIYAELAKPENPEPIVQRGLAGLAWCQVSLADPNSADETLNDLLSKYPKSPLVVGAIFRTAKQLEASDPDQAIARYRQIVDQYSDSELASAADYRLAVLLDNQGSDQAARHALLRLVEKADPKTLDDVLYRLAWIELDSGATAKAKQCFERIHREFDQSPLWEDATYRLAEFAWNADAVDEASLYLGSMVDTNSKSEVMTFARFLLGQIQVSREDWKEAKADFSWVVENNPPESLLELAKFWEAESGFQLGEYELASTQYLELQTDLMGTDSSHLPLIATRLAQIDAHRGEWDVALNRANTIVKDYPDFEQAFEVHYLIGRCLARQANFDDARRAYRRAIDAPESREQETAAMAQWMIGETYFHQRNYDAAIRAYAKVSTTYQQYPKWHSAALLQIGKCHEVQQNWLKATQYYREVIAEHRGTPFAPEAETRLSVVRQRTENATRSERQTQR